MTPFPMGFTHIVGNPPYIRQEELPARLLNLYRSRFATMYDRAELYTAAAVIAAPDGKFGAFRDETSETGIKRFLAAFAARMAEEFCI